MELDTRDVTEPESKKPRVRSPIIERSKFVVDNGGKLDDFYKLDTDAIGTGGFGSVFKGLSKLAKGQVYRAVKSISKPRITDMHVFNEEVAIMKEMDHPNIIKLYESFQDHRMIYLVMELCTGGDLLDYVIERGTFLEIHAAFVAQQMIRAVHYMHEHRVCHRDLKPENFVLENKGPLENNTVKVIDLGMACRFEDGKPLTDPKGTLNYAAPELFSGQYNEVVDMWSLGVVISILLLGRNIFQGVTEQDTKRNICNQAICFSGPEWSNISDYAKQFVSGLLERNPSNRFTCRTALDNKWIVGLTPEETRNVLPLDVVNNLRSFQSQHWFKKAALQAIARDLAEQDVAALRGVFHALDSDGDGVLTVGELQKGMQKQSIVDVTSIIESLDVDRSGTIEYTEFLAAAQDRRISEREDMCWAAFRVFDRDGNGKISKHELEEVLAQDVLESRVKTDQAAELIKEFDLNGDGEIDFEEFMELMKKFAR